VTVTGRAAIPAGVSDEAVAACVSNRMLQLFLLPTEACNFRCVYCYEDLALSRMRPDVVEGVKRYLELRAPELVTLTLSWFGGEPLLARDIVEDVLLHAHTLRRRFPDLELASDITTNAYHLERPVFERLLGLGVTAYQIAFDGPRDWHDRVRVLAGGQGTFDRIWGNVLALREVKGAFKVVVRVHVSKDNAGAIPEFIRDYHRSLAPDPRFSLFVRPLARLGGPNDARLPVLDEGTEQTVVRGLSQCAEEQRVTAVTIEQAMPPICYAAQANTFVVRADGRLNKCTVALEHPRNQVGRLRPDGRMDLDVGRIRPWLRGLESRDAHELECPMHGLVDLTASRAAR
jgi:uncharacterized protein